MTLPNASHGAYCKAVHQTALRFPSPINYPVQCLVSALSWIGFLASAISEYGFDLDFPLTPTFWLAIAFCVMFTTAGHAFVSHRVPGTRKRQIGITLSGDTPSLPNFASSKWADNKSPRVSDRSPNLCQHTFNITRNCSTQMSRGCVIFTASDTTPAVIFLSLAATRGPPENRDQIDFAPDRLARRFCTAQLSSNNSLSGRSPLNIESPTGVPA